MSVGVGAGGSVSEGHGSAEASVGDAEPEADGDGPADVDGSADSVTGSGGGAEECGPALDGVARADRRGASPSPPAAPPEPSPPMPVGALIGAGGPIGVATVQPVTIEIGRPRAISPKKIVLGDNRTSGTPVEY